MTSEDRKRAMQELRWLSGDFDRMECDADTLVECTGNVLKELSQAEGRGGELTWMEVQHLKCLAETAREAELKVRIVGYIMDSLALSIGKNRTPAPNPLIIILLQ